MTIVGWRVSAGSTGKRAVCAGVLAIMLGLAAMPAGALAQGKPSAAEVKQLGDCARAKADAVDGGESCIFILAQPCTETPSGQSTVGEAECYRRETAAWDRLLNDSYARLRDLLDQKQSRKLRDMQRAWLAARDQTCAFYDTLIRGSMAVPAAAACMNRETARRALLLMKFLALAPER